MIAIVLTGPPGPDGGRFVEVERDGKSISAGTWHERTDGLWELRLSPAIAKVDEDWAYRIGPPDANGDQYVLDVRDTAEARR